MKTSLLFPLVALAVRVLADVPPACLLSAVNTQDNPANLSAVCGNEATDVQQAIASLCNDNNASVAQSAFIATCSSAGSSVAPYTPTASATGHSGSATHSAGPTETGTATKSAGGSSATGNTAADVKQVGSFAAAVIAIAGVVAAL